MTRGGAARVRHWLVGGRAGPGDGERHLPEGCVPSSADLIFLLPSIEMKSWIASLALEDTGSLWKFPWRVWPLHPAASLRGLPAGVADGEKHSLGLWDPRASGGGRGILGSI